MSGDHPLSALPLNRLLSSLILLQVLATSPSELQGEATRDLSQPKGPACPGTGTRLPRRTGVPRLAVGEGARRLLVPEG